MTLQLENFGKIRHAEIELNGLTIVAGRNDTGKSTIGKALFAIVKSVSEYPELYEKIKKDTTFFAIRSLCFDAIHDGLIRSNDTLYKEAKEIRNFLLNDDESNLPPVAFSFIEHLVEFYKDKKGKDSIYFKKISAFKKYTDHKADAKEKFNEIAMAVFARTFLSEINNSKQFEDSSKACFNNEKECIAKVCFYKNNVTDATFNESNKAYCFADATFLDSPLYLDDRFHSELYYSYDIKQKLSKAQKNISHSINPSIYKKIDAVLDGATFSVNSERGEWCYSVSKEAKALSISNIASGSKSFGALYAFIKSGVLEKDSILILDEPENHLHPEWQIKYAEILALMVSEGYYILLTSHSPFFLQALRLYADKYGVLENKTHFYLAEKFNDGSNYSNIKDVTDKTEEIFANLAAPLDKLFMVD